MDIWDANKLFLFIIFVVPGFVSLKCYETICLRPQRDASSQIIDAVTYSCINYSLLFLPIYLVESSDYRTTNPVLYVVFYVVVLLLAPISWALIFRFLRAKNFLQKILPHPTAKPWDFVFAQRKQYWAIVTLKGGKQHAGLYGANSFASSAPATEQIYLEQCWKMNAEGGLERKRDSSAGIIIVLPEIETIEFFDVDF